MAVPYAEVIGDPIGHSKSPLIHNFWLRKLGLKAEYRATRVTPADLLRYLAGKRSDVSWRGCNVTSPLKQAAAGLVGAPAGLCEFVGAVNCVTRTPFSCLVGTNTDLAGIGEALKGVPLEGKNAVLIGAGGAARAALCYLLRQGVERVSVAARNPSQAERLAAMMVRSGRSWVEAAALDEAGEEIRIAAVVINATPMGLAGGAPMLPVVLDSLAPAQVAFDMVYSPPETQFLAAAREKGATAIDGLAMLMGQAAPAFELFFGQPAPRQHDAELREFLTS
ncbi:MAG TPA: shikimate dehydrogenase [Allosphingosinicella sp.]|nr:shikimate dehydrogenase [Allosphingosinicella sp.]